MKANSGKILFLGGPMHGRVHKVDPNDRGLRPVVRALVPTPPAQLYTYSPTEPEGSEPVRTVDYWRRHIRTGKPLKEYRFYIAENCHPEDWLDLLLSVVEQNSEKCLTP